ncbi:MAG: hypothetical protein WCF13_01130, partial [Stellaceae bacterium]
MFERHLRGWSPLFWGGVALAALIVVGLWIALRPRNVPHAALPLPVVASVAAAGEMPVVYT